jgi:hypothetical protein
MKTDALRTVLAGVEKAAREAPNTLPDSAAAAMAALRDLLDSTAAAELRDLKLVPRRENIGSLLIKFAELSKFGKQEWIDLVNAYGINLELNPRDSARDVMGRLARYLRDNPGAMAEVPVKTSTPKSTSSGKGSTRGKRHLAENLQETLARLLEE